MTQIALESLLPVSVVERARRIQTAIFTYTRDNNERRVGDTVSNTAYLWHPPATATDTYTPNSLNQYTSINGKTLNYDPNGNLLGDPTAALGSTSYQFDQKNRLTAATNAQYTSTYTYDPFSRRASKTVNGVTTSFVDDGNREIAEYNGATEISHYIYGADSTPILREVFNGASTVQGSYWVHTDALGSLVAITNPNGSHTSTYNYSAFGEPNAVASASAYQYAGMRLDPETMLYYDHARYYSPKQGRFISPDPISVKGGVNIYAYANNDPINGIDTSGLDESEEDGDDSGVAPPGYVWATVFTLVGADSGADYGSYTSYDGGAAADAAAANGGVVGTIPSGATWSLNSSGNIGYHVDYADQINSAGKITENLGVGLIRTGIVGAPAPEAQPYQMAQLTMPLPPPPLVYPSTPSQDFSDAYKYIMKKIQRGLTGKNPDCPACMLQDGTLAEPGTLGYRFDQLDPSVIQHGVSGDHYNYYLLNQNPDNCQCFWSPLKTLPPPVIPGAIPITPVR